MRFVYTGGLSGTRSPRTLLSALNILQHQGELNDIKLQFDFAGQFDRSARRQIEQSRLPFIKSHGQLSFKQSRDLLQRATCPVLIDTPPSAGDRTLHLPSKLLDYVLCRKRVVALTKSESPTDRFLSQGYGIACSSDDPAAIAVTIKAITDAFRGNNHAFFSTPPPPETHSAKLNAERLAQLFQNVLSEEK